MNMNYFGDYVFKSKPFHTLFEAHPPQAAFKQYNARLREIHKHIQVQPLNSGQRKWLTDANNAMPLLENLGICKKSTVLFSLENCNFCVYIFDHNAPLPRIASTIGIFADPTVLNTVSAFKYKKEIDIAKRYIQLLESADSRSLEFNLSMADVAKLVNRKTCFYTKVRFVSNDPHLSKTIDRIDCNKGYVKGNVVACINSINQLKSAMFESKSSHLKITPKMLFNFSAKVQQLVEQ